MGNKASKGGNKLAPPGKAVAPGSPRGGAGSDEFVPTGATYFRLSVTVVQARALAAADRKTSDAYAVVWVGRELDEATPSTHPQRTRACTSLNPVWNDTMTFKFNAKPDFAHIRVLDADKLHKDQPLGEVLIPLAEMWGVEQNTNWVPLSNTPTGGIQYRIVASEEQTIDHTLAYAATLGLLELTIDSVTLPKKCKNAFVEVLFGTRGSSTDVGTRSADGALVEWHQTARLWVAAEAADFVIQFRVLSKTGTAKSGRNKGDVLAVGTLPVRVFLEAAGGAAPSAGAALSGTDLLPFAAHVVQLTKPTEQMLNDSQLAAAAAGFSNTAAGAEAAPDAGEPMELRVCGAFAPRAMLEAQFLSEALTNYDTNADGSLQREELESMILTMAPDMEDGDLEALVDTFDQDASGEVSAAEVAQCIASENFQRHPMAFHILAHMLHGREGVASMVHDLYESVARQADGSLRHPKTTVDRDGKSHEGLFVLDRRTGLIVEEHIPAYIRSALKSMYDSKTGRTAVHTTKVKKLLETMSANEGKKMNSPESAKKIPEFIKTHNLDVSEFEKPVEEYTTFNEFFSRRLRPGVRPVAAPADNRVFTSPADCRVTAFTDVFEATNLWIKGAHFTLENLLQSDELAARFHGGSLMISRLSPQDYHRWHFPFSATAVREVRRIGGTLYTVNPIAVRKNVDVFTENVRIVSVFDTAELGTAVMVAVGATVVGSITILPAGQVGGPQLPVKGEEAGYFEFGGSTVLTLFERGRVAFDADLVDNTSRGLETLVQVGMQVGVARSAAGAGAAAAAATS